MDANTSESGTRSFSRATADAELRPREQVRREIAFIPNASFKSDADRTDWADTPLLQAVEEGHVSAQVPAVSGLPAQLMRMCEIPVLDVAEERALFRRMNFLKYQANRLSAKLDEDVANSETIEDLDELVERAGRIRNYLVQANVRLVMSIAKKYANATNAFDDLLSEGLNSLMHIVEKFDYDRGFRFSTYATTSIQRDLYRLVAKNRDLRCRFNTGTDEILASSPEQHLAVTPRQTTTVEAYGSLTEMLEQLDPREKLIIRSRFGFDTEGAKKATYTSLAKQLGISKERVRQLAERAIGKLRAAAPDFGLVGGDV